MNLIWFAQKNWDDCWTEKQHLAMRLARRGHRVLYVDPYPVSPDATPGNIALALRAPASRLGLVEREPRLWSFTHHKVRRAGRRFNDWWRRHALRALARQLVMTDPVVVTFRPDTADLFVQLDPVASLYYAVDEWTGFGGFSEEKKRRYREQEEQTLRTVDVALGVSSRLVDRFRTLQPRSYVMENGADTEHFAPPRLARTAPHPRLAALPRPRVGLIGQIDERVDQELLLHLSQARPQWQIVLAGRVKQGVDVSALRARPNVHFLGFEPYERLPGVMRELDAGLIPYHLTDLTQSCNPAKAFEYLAAGLPVVATPLEGLQVARGVIRLASTHEAFLAQLDAALADPEPGRADRLRVAKENNWDSRTDELERRLDEAVEAAAAEAGTRRRTFVPGWRAREAEAGLALYEPPRSRLESYGARRPPAGKRLLLRGVNGLGRLYHLLRVTGRFASGRRPARIRKILVARRGYLGDMIAFRPTLESLRRAYPHAHIVFAVNAQRPDPALLEGSPVDEVRVIDFYAMARQSERLKAAVSLFCEGFDLVITGGNAFFLYETVWTGAPHRVGLYDGDPRQELLTAVVPQDHARHEAENNLAILEALGVQPDPADRTPTVAVARAAASAAVAPLLARLGVPDRAQVLTIHPGSKRLSRRWPEERVAEVARRVLEARPTLHVIFTGVREERELAESLREAIPADVRSRAHAAAGATDLTALIGLVDRSAVVMSNDTGVMHLARARGAPLVALLGPGAHRQWGPHPQGIGPAVALHAQVPCAPCLRWECQTHYCMRSLEVEPVLAAVEELLDRSGFSPAAREPAAAASLPLVPLSYRGRRLTWDDLAARSLEPPLVSVLIDAEQLAPPQGAEAGGGEGGAAALREALAAAAAQLYPRLEIIVMKAAAASADIDDSAIARPLRSVARPPGAGPLEALAAALAAASGELLSLPPATGPWRSDRVGTEIALLVRLPEAAAATPLEIFSHEKLLKRDELTGMAVRREALRAWLAARGAAAADASPAGQLDAPRGPSPLDEARARLVVRPDLP